MKMLRLILPLAAVFVIVSSGMPAMAILHATTPVNDATQDKLIGSGTLIKIEMLQTVSSAHSKAGDKFAFRVVQDVMAGTRVAIPAATEGSGKVLEARPARGGRTDGHLRVEFDPINLKDGTNVKLAITQASLIADENEHNGAAGSVAEIADMTIPGFFILDFLRKGDNITLGAGAPFHVAVTEDAFLSQ
jgi:hypothetical protein